MTDWTAGVKYTPTERQLRRDIELRHGKTPEDLYDEREKRVREAIQLKEPDRVPVSLRMTYYPATHCKIPKSAAYYDAFAWKTAITKSVFDLEPDLYQCSSGMSSGAVMAALEPTQTKWPGGALAPDLSHQAIDVECLKEGEYDLFLSDPTDFTLRYLLPRGFIALSPLANLPAINERFVNFPVMTPSFTGQEFAQMAKLLYRAGREQKKWARLFGNLEEDMAKLGFPPHATLGGVGGAPFDTISDFYRGMRGAMTDMYRCPDKLMAACDLLLEWRVKRAAPADPQKRGNPKRLFLALHRGAEGFMSRKQFEKFYWPGLKKAMLKSIELGFVPIPFCEGKFGDRLEYFLELPKGKVVAHFEQTDMARAKEVLKDHTCIMGNVPSSLLQVGSVSEVEDYCRKLIKVCGKGGGFILTNGSSIDEAKPANVKAMVDSVKKFRP